MFINWYYRVGSRRSWSMSTLDRRGAAGSLSSSAFPVNQVKNIVLYFML